MEHENSIKYKTDFTWYQGCFEDFFWIGVAYRRLTYIYAYILPLLLLQLRVEGVLAPILNVRVHGLPGQVAENHWHKNQTKFSSLENYLWIESNHTRTKWSLITTVNVFYCWSQISIWKTVHIQTNNKWTLNEPPSCHRPPHQLGCILYHWNRKVWNSAGEWNGILPYYIPSFLGFFS